MIRATTAFRADRLLKTARRRILATIEKRRRQDGSHWRDARLVWPQFREDR
ncbi:MAG: hypothetical protein WA948_04075 [Pontixanthobacter sp.]